MKSPFPGMDPYLEQFWRDVHHRLVIYACDQLQPGLPGGLRARVEERVFVENEAGAHCAIYPDVHVIEHRRGPSAPAAEGAVAVAESFMIRVADEPVTEGYLEIVEVGSGHRVVTVIEFLSPSNKVPGEGRELYLRKQKEVKAAGASLVEIDLTRGGHRPSVLPVYQIPPEHRTTYQICVHRGWESSTAEVYRAPLSARLPTIRIPLRQSDQDVPLDLQSLLDQCYRNGRYDDLNYRAALDPSLEASEEAWADALLRAQGLR